MIKNHGRGDLQITWRDTNKEKVTLRKSYYSYLKGIGTCSLSERKTLWCCNADETHCNFGEHNMWRQIFWERPFRMKFIFYFRSLCHISLACVGIISFKKNKKKGHHVKHFEAKLSKYAGLSISSFRSSQSLIWINRISFILTTIHLVYLIIQIWWC